MVIENNRENHGHDKKQDQDAFIICSHDEQEEKADQQDQELCGDDISENCSHKKAFLAFEERHALGAVMPNVKRLANNP